jgi:hypothetical protein
MGPRRGLPSASRYGHPLLPRGDRGVHVESRQVICEQAGDRSAFLCAVHKLAQYNATLTGADLKQLDEFPADGVFNGIPVAAEDSLVTGEDTAATVDVLANETDPDGEVLSVTSPLTKSAVADSLRL